MGCHLWGGEEKGKWAHPTDQLSCCGSRWEGVCQWLLGRHFTDLEWDHWKPGWTTYCHGSYEDGRRVAATRNGAVLIWDVQTQDLVAGPLQVRTEGSYTTAFSPDGSRIAMGAGGGSACIWDSVSGEVIFDSLRGHTRPVWWTAFTPDGRHLVTASDDMKTCRWDIQSGTLLGTPLTGHSGVIHGGAISPDGKTLASASIQRSDGQILGPGNRQPKAVYP
ncbi:tricorn protease domain 2-containing protein [Gyrodon lividus]|nr:tricorn protease domain 2-containing protein [Gyrodon lividus]